jgi:ABC-2 type transport system ATP-binding protein
MIQIENVSKQFGAIEAVSQISFRVARGSIFGVVGSDGAGKTTLFRIIATMIQPSSGSIRVGGFDVVSQRSQAKGLIGYMPQRFGLYPDLTVQENLDFFMDIYGITGAERERRKQKYLGFSNLVPFVTRQAGDLSGGMKQKLGLACVLVHQPKILILDEPTNGVDPVSRKEFWDILLEMKEGDMTILVSTSYLDEGEKCDRLALLHHSAMLAEGPPKQMQGSFSSLEEAMIAYIQESDQTLIREDFGV